MREGWKRGGWKACGVVKMGCIMTPMPNHLSTHLSLFYYSSFDEWGRCGEHTPKNKNHTKQCGNKEKCRCGNDEEE